MVITDKCVYIYKPKTGGTFVTDALLKLYDGKWNLFIHARLALLKAIHYKIQFRTLSFTANKPGGCRDIPKEHLQKKSYQRSGTLLIIISRNMNYLVEKKGLA